MDIEELKRDIEILIDSTCWIEYDEHGGYYQCIACGSWTKMDPEAFGARHVHKHKEDCRLIKICETIGIDVPGCIT